MNFHMGGYNAVAVKGRGLFYHVECREFTKKANRRQLHWPGVSSVAGYGTGMIDLGRALRNMSRDRRVQ